jgi:hypothetical protein
MKRQLLLLLFIFITVSTTLKAQRYLSEIFPTVSVTADIVYGQNMALDLLNGGLDTVQLKADVYEPIGDTMSARATVIMIHTGSFLPIFYNGQATGTKTDSTITEMCRQFARRGYTAIAMDYRLGWNPQALGPAGQDIRTGTLLCAVYRALQDVKACVRYFRNDANNTNTYHIDESKFILGGMGSGGYVALAYTVLNNPAQIALPKFLAATNDAQWGFTAGQSYVNQSLWGDFDGYAGTPGYNIATNTPGVNNDVAFIFNCGGALGDSSWLQTAPNPVPVVCFHPENDPFAPYKDGSVIVPTTGDFVVDVSGSWRIMRIADSLGINASFQNNTWTDPFTLRANQINDGYDGLFPFMMSDPPGPSPGQAGPWEWFDSTTVYSICLGFLNFTMGRTDSVWYNSLATNPDMSKTKATAYIDTIMGYVNPRIVAEITVGIDESVNQSQLSAYPNPAADFIDISMNNKTGILKHLQLFDLSGKLVREEKNIASLKYRMNLKDISTGIYMLKAVTSAGEHSIKLSISK